MIDKVDEKIKEDIKAYLEANDLKDDPEENKNEDGEGKNAE